MASNSEGDEESITKESKEDTLESEYSSTEDKFNKDAPFISSNTIHNQTGFISDNNDNNSSTHSSFSTSNDVSSDESESNSGDTSNNSDGETREDKETEGFFYDEDNNTFLSEIIDHASSFISIDGNRMSSSSSPSLSPSSSITDIHQLVTSATTNNTILQSLSPQATPTLVPPQNINNQKIEEHLIKAPPTKPHPLKSKRRCEECTNCLNNVNCKKCRFCQDMKKYGGLGRLRQKCIERQCLKLSRVLAQEMGGAKEERGVVIPTLMDGMSSTVPTLSKDSKPFYVTTSEATPKITPTSKPIKKQPIQQQKKKPKNKKPSQTTRKKVLKKRPINKREGDSSEEEEEEMSYRPTRRRPLSDLYESWKGTIKSSEDTKRQCLGPQCMYAARSNSKYCSEECGVELAMRRIQTYLPKAKEVWHKGEEPVASKLNREKLTQLEMDQTRMKERLEVLNSHSAAINDHVSKMKEIKVSQREDETGDSNEISDDLTIYCATCGQPTPLKKAFIHMERCFTKLEGMVSFGSIVKNEGIDIFCDKYDRAQGTYCKRLKVLCPEHTKEPKAGPNEICGCPLEADFPSKKNNCTLYCHNLKKNCPGHYCWEKLRRAEIDQEKLNLYLKLEETGEQTRLYQWQLSYRSSMIAMMLHHTIEH